MVRNVAGDLVEAVLALDDLKNTAGRVFEKLALAVAQVLLLDDLHHVIVEEVVCQPHLRDAAGIEERNGRAVGNRLSEIILTHVVAEPLVSETL